MGKIAGSDAQRIIQMFENELNVLQGVSNIEKMQYRRKIMNTLMPIFAVSDLKVETVISEVERKLSDLFRMFQDGDGFKEKLRRALHDKLK